MINLLRCDVEQKINNRIRVIERERSSPLIDDDNRDCFVVEENFAPNAEMRWEMRESKQT